MLIRSMNQKPSILSLVISLTVLTLALSLPRPMMARNTRIAGRFQVRSLLHLHPDSDDGVFDEYSDGNPFDDLGAGDGLWKLTNDFPTFLNQVTIQSFIFLIASLKDRHTALWIEDFTQPVIRTRSKDKESDEVLSNMAKALNNAMQESQVEREIRLLSYHGLGAINTTIFPTWDSYFEQLLQEPGFTYSIESSRSHIPSYELEINPASLCSRLISVREQIAREFVTDLDALAEISSQMLQQDREDLKTEGRVELIKPNLLFLEMSVHSDYRPSPLRTGNYDLLTNLATQEAIHRLLNGDTAHETGLGTESRSTILFLRNFYVSRVGAHFTGNNWYGRADEFIGELLNEPPGVVQLQDEVSDRVDPLKVAELVLKQREKVAEEWLEMALDIPQSHTAIKRWQLDRLMGRIDNAVSESPGFE